MKVVEMEKRIMKPRRISVSSKRQITIPLEFFKQLRIEDEVECYMEDGKIIIRPIVEEGEIAEFVLKELVEEGYTGKKLLEEFRKRKVKLGFAARKMIAEADKVAESSEEYCGIDDIFE